jgi:hypothetical protein
VEGELLSALGTVATVGEVAMGTGRTYCHTASINHKNNHDRPRQAWVAMSRALITTLLNRGLIYLELLSVAVKHERKIGGRSGTDDTVSDKDHNWIRSRVSFPQSSQTNTGIVSHIIARQFASTDFQIHYSIIIIIIISCVLVTKDVVRIGNWIY